MARPDQEAIDTFMNITGVNEATAIQKLEEHQGNLNGAVNAYFSEGDGNLTQGASFTSTREDDMDIDEPVPLLSRRPPSSLLPFARDMMNPFSLLDPNFTRSIFDIDSAPVQSPFVSHPREVREIPIEVKDGTGASSHSGGALTIEDVTETAHEHGPEIRGTVTVDDEDDGETSPNAPITHAFGPNAPTIVDEPDYAVDIEEEMIRAAIEASKQDVAMSSQQSDDLHDVRDLSSQPAQPHREDADLAHAVSLSLQTAEQEKVLRELEGKVGPSEVGQISATSEDTGKLLSNGRQSQLEPGRTSLQDEDEDLEEQPLVRRRRRRVSSGPINTANNTEEVDVTAPSSPRQQDNVRDSEENRSVFPSDEWGGISSEEHDEAVMLEAAMFGGVPYAPHQLMQNGLSTSLGPYPRRTPRPPSPSLTAQRLIREQQDDEFIAALLADREKELKAKEEAEAALAEERRKEDELHRKRQEEEETERQLAAKEVSLPQEPTPDDQNAVTILVRMPDGNRLGRRFLKSDKLQCLFDFIDVGRVVKPGSYRLVRPYPRRAFSDGECSSSLHELGLSSKQEALLGEIASPRGSPVHRLVAYFTEALSLRAARLWPHVFHVTAPRELDRADEDSGLSLRLLNQVSPIPKFIHFTSNEILLRAFEGKDRVHIIDFDVKNGLQWPSLFQSLASRTNPPSHVRITGIGESKQELIETGDRLSGFAEALNLNFEFHPVVDRLEDVRLWMLHVKERETVAVNCVFQLHKLLYDSSGRTIRDFLGLIRSTKPETVVMAEQEGAHNEVGLDARLCNSLRYYSAVFDAVDSSGLASESPVRVKIEEMFGREIRNVIACEGRERLERHQISDRWREVMEGGGFRSMGIDERELFQGRMLLRMYGCEEYGVERSGSESVTLRWLDQPLYTVSAWTPVDDVAGSSYSQRS
ncbi:scarecrow-like protein 28 [Phtheirospermum japonicum]|uniref:Scarecrow-like protein 28 n=1 Tax=Phtheirospermum japonicum TaxID=374723 RepID=A0A830BKF1_9LAMI|nr:scarecrow-like protein 28 [Phtheirospermum japonicum]